MTHSGPVCENSRSLAELRDKIGPYKSSGFGCPRTGRDVRLVRNPEQRALRKVSTGNSFFFDTRFEAPVASFDRALNQPQTPHVVIRIESFTNVHRLHSQLLASTSGVSVGESTLDGVLETLPELDLTFTTEVSLIALERFPVESNATSASEKHTGIPRMSSNPFRQCEASRSFFASSQRRTISRSLVRMMASFFIHGIPNIFRNRSRAMPDKGALVLTSADSGTIVNKLETKSILSEKISISCGQFACIHALSLLKCMYSVGFGLINS